MISNYSEGSLKKIWLPPSNHCRNCINLMTIRKCILKSWWKLITEINNWMSILGENYTHSKSRGIRLHSKGFGKIW